MYGLPDTSREIYNAFTRTNENKASKEDYRTLSRHIENKKREIKEAKRRLGIDGLVTKPSPIEFPTMSQVMKEVDGGRRLRSGASAQYQEEER